MSMFSAPCRRCKAVTQRASRPSSAANVQNYPQIQMLNVQQRYLSLLEEKVTMVLALLYTFWIDQEYIRDGA